MIQQGETSQVDIVHAVLLYKIDQTGFYIKNSYRGERIIKIPHNRPTFYHRFVYDNFKQGTIPIDEVVKKFDLYSHHKLDWNIQPDDWYLQDTGYLMKFQKTK